MLFMFNFRSKYKKTTIFLTALLALYGLASGASMLLGLASTLPEGAPPEAQKFFQAILDTNYLFQFMAVFKITCAILILIPRTAPLGAIMFFPYTVHIFLWSVVLFGAIPPGVMVLGLNIGLIYCYLEHYKPMIARQS